MLTLPSKPLRKRASIAALREKIYPKKLRKGDKDINDGIKYKIIIKKIRSKCLYKMVRQRIRKYYYEYKKKTGRSRTDKKVKIYKTKTVNIYIICQHSFCLDCLHENIARRGEFVKAI